jgi:endonuclease YncB( thermonuclease family)
VEKADAVHRDKTMNLYTGNIERVVDGDTLVIDIDLGFDIHYKCRVRLLGVLAPELSTKRGRDCKEYFGLQLDKDVTVIVELHGKDRYGRWLGNVTRSDNGLSINDLANMVIADSGEIQSMT